MCSALVSFGLFSLLSLISSPVHVALVSVYNLSPLCLILYMCIDIHVLIFKDVQVLGHILSEGIPASATCDYPFFILLDLYSFIMPSIYSVSLC